MSNEAFLRARTDEIQVANDKLQHGGSEGFVQGRLGVPPPLKRKHSKRRPIILGARPAGEVESSVRIDAGFRPRRIAEDLRDLGVGPHILQEGWLNLVTQTPVTKKLPAVQAAQGSTELDKLPQTIDSGSHLDRLRRRRAQRVDDDRRIPEPVEEIVGVGIISGEDRRGHHRSRLRNDALSKARAILDEMGGRDGAQHRAGGEVRLLVYPVVERSHDPAEAKCGLLKPSLFMPSRISGMPMNRFQMRPLR